MPQDGRVAGLASIAAARHGEVGLSGVASDRLGTQIPRIPFALAGLGLKDRRQQAARLSSAGSVTAAGRLWGGGEGKERLCGGFPVFYGLSFWCWTWPEGCRRLFFLADF